MRRAMVLPLAMAALVLVAGCKDAGLPSSPRVSGPSRTISDGAHAVGGTGDTIANSHFWWLPPMVPEPEASLLGTFDPALRPTVDVVCLKTDDPAVTECDGNRVAGPFGLGSGLTVGDSLYQVDLDVKGFAASTTNGKRETSYRIEVKTPAFPGIGGPYTFGYADFQVGETGKAAKNLANPDAVIGLKDGRTLPIKFRLDRGAQAEEFEQNGVLAARGLGDLCTQNCSVTVLGTSAGDTSEASLYDGSGTELTAMQVPGSALSETKTLLISEQSVGAGGTCAPEATLVKDACYRYALFPDEGTGDFLEPVRYGICPDPSGPDVANGALDSRWRLLKADVVNDEIQVRRPDEVDVSDFLTCAVEANPPVALWSGPLGRAAGKVLTWLVRPVQASHLLGGRLQDLSDLFWGLDAVVEPVGDTVFAPGSAGATVHPTVKIQAVHLVQGTAAADTPGIAGETVVFEANGGTLGSTGATTLTVVADATGEATVDWTVGSGTSTLTATTDHALVDSAGIGLSRPITFTATTPSGPITFTDVATGTNHACALSSDGEVYCWGANGEGELGTGDTNQSLVPVLVSGGHVFESINSGGGNHTCGLTGGGEAWCWGQNAFGQLGDGTTVDRDVPVRAAPGLSFTSLSVGTYHTCGIASGGGAYCWGSNAAGVSGPAGSPASWAFGTPTSGLCDSPFGSYRGTQWYCSPTPVAVPGPTLVSIDAGMWATCGLSASGTAYCTGWNALWALGNGTSVNAGSLTPVAGGYSFDRLSLGAVAGCGISAGTARCWGGALFPFGVTGSGSVDGDSVPVPVAGGLSFGAIHPSGANDIYSFTCGLTATGDAYCWGLNGSGELGTTVSLGTCTAGGDNVIPCSPTPVPVAAPGRFTAIATGQEFACGVGEDGQVYCWGINTSGQLGDGTTTVRGTPVPVSPPSP